MARGGVLKRSLQGAGLGIVAALAMLAFWRSGYLDHLENATWTWRVRTFAKRSSPPTPPIKLILVDGPSLEWLRKENKLSWPWPRAVFGAVVDFCRRGGAKAIVFDMLYTEPSVCMAEDDAIFGQAIQRGTGFVGAVFLSPSSGEFTHWPTNVPRALPDFIGLEHWISQNSGYLVLSNATFPVPEVATNATMLANVFEQTVADGVFRRAALFRVFDGFGIPSLSLAAFLSGEKGIGQMPSVELKENVLKIGERLIPINRQGQALLNYRATNAYPAYSAAAVVQSELRLQENKVPPLQPDLFTNAYVLFGLSAPGLHEAHPTPMNPAAPGVQIHATALDNLVTSSFLRDMPVWCVCLTNLFLGALSGGVITQSRRARHSVLSFALLAPVPVIAGFIAYSQGWWWPIAVTEATVLVALIGGDLFNYATEGRQKAFLKRAFNHYLGAEVIEQIIDDPSRLQLGGEKRELTLFFSDIEKFSTFSEKLDPQTLTSLLNDYLSDMTDVILEEGGYLDKYIGDAIVAFWNAPTDQPDHCIRAVRTVLRCQRRLKERRPIYQERTGVVIKARIGLHTGAVTVGNMGSRDRFNYTVLGDAANLASRLEGANKVFGTYNLISEITWNATEGQFLGRELGRIRVVGREQPIGVYEVLGLADQAKPEFLVDFEAGRDLCRAGHWDQALKLFERYPQDPPSQAYLIQCRQRLGGPSQPWDGIWNLTEK